MNNTIEIKGLKKRYDNFELGEINLNINSGYIIGLDYHYSTNTS